MPVTSEKNAAARGYVAGKFGIQLGGTAAGWVQNVRGGHATSDVVTEKMGPDHILRKHIAGVKYEEIALKVGTGMSKAFYDWIKSTFARAYGRVDGAIQTCTYDLKEQSRLEFFQALISEIGFPALDAASKDAALLTLKFQPETTRMKPGSKAAVSGLPAKTRPKPWLLSNFRLKIDGLDCTRVSKIGALVVAQKNSLHAVGELRDYQTEPTSVEIPNLVVTLAESHAKEFYDWHEDFVIRGNNGEDKTKGGTLEYLSPDLHDALFTLKFSHAGIFKLDQEEATAGSESIQRVTAELYLEDMTFEHHASVG